MGPSIEQNPKTGHPSQFQPRNLALICHKEGININNYVYRIGPAPPPRFRRPTTASDGPSYPNNHPSLTLAPRHRATAPNSTPSLYPAPRVGRNPRHDASPGRRQEVGGRGEEKERGTLSGTPHLNPHPQAPDRRWASPHPSSPPTPSPHLDSTSPHSTPCSLRPAPSSPPTPPPPQSSAPASSH